VLSLLFSAVEGVSYVGFITSQLGIDPNIVYAISVLLSPYALPLPKRFRLILWYFTATGLVLFAAIIFAESITYPNYVFSHLHINPYTITPVILLLVFHSSILSETSILKSILLSGLIYLGVTGAGKTLGLIGHTFVAIAKDPFISYSAKMSNAYPGFYALTQTIKSLTPADATILIPPQGNPWETEGNSAMVRYFLYPRTVANLDPSTVSELADNTYLVIAKGSWKRIGDTDYGWPKVVVPAKKLWQIDQDGQILSTVARDYNPSTDVWDWGLIEVKHE